MKYILLLTQDPSIAPEGTEPDPEEMAAWGALYQEMNESGVLITAMGLADDDTATTVRTRDGESVLTDGPYAESKEALFSFFVIDVADLDAAVGWAKKCPAVNYGSVEVRPLSEHEQD